MAAAHRSVIQTLDLADDYGQSSRISFSTDFLASPQSGRETPDGSIASSSSCYSAEFEFSMTSASFHNAVSQGFMMPADELFHGGKLLPGYITPDGKKEVLIVAPFCHEEEEVEDERAPVAIARHLSSESLSEKPSSSSSGCGRNPIKTPKWRELFGALRRVKSDHGGHQRRAPEEALLPPKPQGRKKLFKHLFGSNVPPPAAVQDSAKMSSISSSVILNRCYTGAADPGAKTSSISSSAILNRWYTGGAASPSTPLPLDSKLANPPQESGVTALEMGSSRGMETEGGSSRGVRFSALGVPVRKVDRPIGTSLTRSASGRVIARNATSNAKKNSASLQEEMRALRSREIRRSPDRSSGFSSSVRVTPVLNVPVCMGPMLLHGASSSKGRLSHLRSLLSFKREKLSSTPIAAQ